MTTRTTTSPSSVEGPRKSDRLIPWYFVGGFAIMLIANISLLFTERPLLERIPSAVAAGFDGVEIQFPYGSDPVLIAQAAAGCPIHLINAPAGDPGAGDVGLATDAARVAGVCEGPRSRRLRPLSL